jgi:hypothetical protein
VRRGGDQAALVAEDAVGSDQNIARDCLPKHLYAQHVGNDLLRLAIQVWEHAASGRSAALGARGGFGPVCVRAT